MYKTSSDAAGEYGTKYVDPCAADHPPLTPRASAPAISSPQRSSSSRVVHNATQPRYHLIGAGSPVTSPSSPQPPPPPPQLQLQPSLYPPLQPPAAARRSPPAVGASLTSLWTPNLPTVLAPRTTDGSSSLSTPHSSPGCPPFDPVYALFVPLERGDSTGSPRSSERHHRNSNSHNHHSHHRRSFSPVTATAQTMEYTHGPSLSATVSVMLDTGPTTTSATSAARGASPMTAVGGDSVAGPWRAAAQPSHTRMFAERSTSFTPTMTGGSWWGSLPATAADMGTQVFTGTPTALLKQQQGKQPQQLGSSSQQLHHHLSPRNHHIVVQRPLHDASIDDCGSLHSGHAIDLVWGSASSPDGGTGLCGTISPVHGCLEDGTALSLEVSLVDYPMADTLQCNSAGDGDDYSRKGSGEEGKCTRRATSEPQTPCTPKDRIVSLSHPTPPALPVGAGGSTNPRWACTPRMGISQPVTPQKSLRRPQPAHRAQTPVSFASKAMNISLEAQSLANLSMASATPSPAAVPSLLALNVAVTSATAVARPFPAFIDYLAPSRNPYVALHSTIAMHTIADATNQGNDSHSDSDGSSSGKRPLPHAALVALAQLVPQPLRRPRTCAAHTSANVTTTTTAMTTTNTTIMADEPSGSAGESRIQESAGIGSLSSPMQTRMTETAPSTLGKAASTRTESSKRRQSGSQEHGLSLSPATDYTRPGTDSVDRLRGSHGATPLVRVPGNSNGSGSGDDNRGASGSGGSASPRPRCDLFAPLSGDGAAVSGGGGGDVSLFSASAERQLFANSDDDNDSMNIKSRFADDGESNGAEKDEKLIGTGTCEATPVLGATGSPLAGSATTWGSPSSRELLRSTQRYGTVASGSQRRTLSPVATTVDTAVRPSSPNVSAMPVLFSPPLVSTMTGPLPPPLVLHPLSSTVSRNATMTPFSSTPARRADMADSTPAAGSHTTSVSFSTDVSPPCTHKGDRAAQLPTPRSSSATQKSHSPTSAATAASIPLLPLLAGPLLPPHMNPRTPTQPHATTPAEDAFLDQVNALRLGGCVGTHANTFMRSAPSRVTGGGRQAVATAVVAATASVQQPPSSAPRTTASRWLQNASVLREGNLYSSSSFCGGSSDDEEAAAAETGHRAMGTSIVYRGNSGGVEEGSDGEDSEVEPGERFLKHHTFQFAHYPPYPDKETAGTFAPLSADTNGLVWLATHRLDGLPYAVKEIVLDSDASVRQLAVELECLTLGNDAATAQQRQAEAFLVRYMTCKRYPAAVLYDGNNNNSARSYSRNSSCDPTLSPMRSALPGMMGGKRNHTNNHSSSNSGGVVWVSLLQTEYFPRGSLWECVTRGRTRASLRRFPWHTVLAHCLSGLDALHSSGLVHGCPLPFNIFVSGHKDAHFKLGNLGSAARRPRQYPSAAPSGLLPAHSSHGGIRSSSDSKHVSATPSEIDVHVLCSGLLALFAALLSGTEPVTLEAAFSCVNAVDLAELALGRDGAVIAEAFGCTAPVRRVLQLTRHRPVSAADALRIVGPVCLDELAACGACDEEIARLERELRAEEHRAASREVVAVAPAREGDIHSSRPRLPPLAPGPPWQANGALRTARDGNDDACRPAPGPAAARHSTDRSVLAPLERAAALPGAGVIDEKDFPRHALFTHATAVASLYKSTSGCALPTLTRPLTSWECL